jgi:outer membrane receptor protein involved in Fe transport
MSINGSRSSSISFNLDGGDNNDQELNHAASPLPSPDALQEFTVITSNYQADLGRSSGGILNAVVRSGTSKLRGNLRYIGINEVLNARGFFDPRVPLDRLNTFGGQIGGPVKLPRIFKSKDRAYFFFDYEGTRSGRETLSNAVLPSEPERTGKFDNLFERRPRDPLTGQRFPQGIIPRGRISPIARLYLERFIPLPNIGERNFLRLLLTGFQTDQITSRLDCRIAEADTMSATFYSTTSAINADTGNLPVGSKTETHGRNQNLILRETHIFSKRTVNQFIGTVARFVTSDMNISSGATGVNPSALGFTGVHPQSAVSPGAPSVSILGTDVRITTGGDSVTARTTWQIKDDLSYTRGDHALKFGAEVRGFIQNTSVGSNNGSFTFSDVNTFGTGNGIADFLLGIPFSYDQTTGSTRHPRQDAYYLYGMDDWRLRPNLTINLGLRYELVPPVKDTLDKVNAFRPGQRSEHFPGAPPGLLFAGDRDPLLGTVPQGLYPTDKNNLAPRLGVAYSPKPDSGWLKVLLGESKTALRAAWGIFFDQTLGFSFTQVSSTQPFSVTQVLDAGQTRSFADPFGALPNLWPLDLSKRAFIGIPQLETIEPGFRTAYTYQYNFTVQRELPGSLLLEAAYVGNHSFKLSRQRELNEGVAGPGADASNLQSRRVYPYLGSILSEESSGRARYDSFQLRLRRRFSNGLMLDGSYVFGKALDNGSSSFSGSFTNPFRWARSAYDRTHNFVVSYLYDFPNRRFSGGLNSVLNGWGISGITEFRSGLPMDINQSVDTTLTGRYLLGNPDFVGPYIRLDPRKHQTIVVDGTPQTGNFFFNPNAFHAVAVDDYKQARPGTLGRNVCDGPGLGLWSVSIIKRFRISEPHQIVFRSDIRNVFNHANFQTPSLQANDSFTFGQVSLAAPGRNVQLSLRYSF